MAGGRGGLEMESKYYKNIVNNYKI